MVVKVFREDLDNPLESLRNKKSNLVMSLITLHTIEEKGAAYEQIIKYELELAKMEIERHMVERAASHCDNAHRFMYKLGGLS